MSQDAYRKQTLIYKIYTQTQALILQIQRIYRPVSVMMAANMHEIGQILNGRKLLKMRYKYKKQFKNSVESTNVCVFLVQAAGNAIDGSVGEQISLLKYHT